MNKEYELINLNFEYPDFTGEVVWAVVTDLSMEELMDKYIEELRRYLPVIVLTVEQGNAFKTFNRNEKKHRMRMLRTYELNGYIEGWTEEEHICKYSCDELDMMETYLEYRHLRELVDSLPEVQKRRCKLYYFYGFSEEEIARIEGVDQSSVSRSLYKAIRNIKNNF